MIDELGHILREARESRGLALKDVQADIRINARFLEALESGEYEALPSPAHVRGFLRNYARYLGLDPQPLLDRYSYNHGHHMPAVTIGSRETRPETLLPARDDQPFFDPVNVDVGDGRQRNPEGVLRLIIIGALIIALVLVANRFLPLILANGDGTEVISQVRDVIQGNNSPDETASAADDAVPTGEAVTSTSRNNFETELPTQLPTRPALPATLETIPLKLEVTERTWMEVTIDGDIVFTGIARAGDPPYEWEALTEAKVVAGNAIGVFVTIGDIQLGRLGGRGENMEETWRTTN